MNKYRIVTPHESIIIEADNIQERTSHFVLLKKTSKSGNMTESEVVALCPKTSQFIIVKIGE